jgi:hypothetical protein
MSAILSMIGGLRRSPHPDSIENKLLEFFDRNPSEELCVTDAVTKFGARFDTTSKLMRSMADRGLLSRRKEGREAIYASGRAAASQGAQA